MLEWRRWQSKPERTLRNDDTYAKVLDTTFRDSLASTTSQSIHHTASFGAAVYSTINSQRGIRDCLGSDATCSSGSLYLSAHLQFTNRELCRCFQEVRVSLRHSIVSLCCRSEAPQSPRCVSGSPCLGKACSYRGMQTSINGVYHLRVLDYEMTSG